MCIAIVKKKNGNITDEALRNSFRSNPDGAGIAYVKDNTIYMTKGIFDENVFINAVRQAEQITEGDMLIHCRIGTSGCKDAQNCHPHKVNDANVLIHNGILNIDVPKGSEVSDTILFIQRYMQNLPNDFAYNNSILSMLEKLIGTNNKFCILNTNGDTAIINESAGHWVDNVWYSNASYKSYSRYFSAYEDWEWEVSISKKEKKRILNTINNLTVDDFYKLGAYPTCDVKTGKLYPEYENKYPYLDEIDWELTDLYAEIYGAFCYDDFDYEDAVNS